MYVDLFAEIDLIWDILYLQKLLHNKSFYLKMILPVVLFIDAAY